MDTSAIKREVVQSDMMKIFLAVVSTFTFLIVVKVYFGLNGEPANEWMKKVYPFITISQSASTTLKHFWVLFTQMFIESSVMSLFSNFLWLWLFGFILEDLRGRNQVLPLYIFSGFICGLVILACTTINQQFFKMDFYHGMQLLQYGVILLIKFFKCLMEASVFGY
jgi:membrane associated rhomboid family serine protease